MNNETYLAKVLKYKPTFFAQAAQSKRVMSDSLNHKSFFHLFQGKIWNIRQCKLLFSLVGHNGCVFCVDLDDDCKRAFTGSGDRVSHT